MDLQYKCDPRASTQPLSLDGDNNLSNHLIQNLKQDRFEYNHGGDLSVAPKKIKAKAKKARPVKPLPQPSHPVTHIYWNHWRVFYYVVKAGGFVKAKYYLRTSQSSISRSIQAIEKILDQQLLIRCIPKTDTVMSLTPVGAKIFAEISQAIEIFESFNPYAYTKIKSRRTKP